VRDRLQLTLLDTLGVTAAGARTEEMRALVEAWQPPAGPARLVGTSRSATMDAAAWINGTAACSLELDEGNKYARGHPATHAFPAALALAETIGASGEELCSALLAGHEVASRFGRAFTPAPGVHPHGHWGAAGAAAAAARLMRLGPVAVAGAIDAAGGLPLATHMAIALRGSFVRNTWIGAANVNGLVAARLAAAGLAGIDETAQHTVGKLLGRLDPDRLVEELGTRFDVTHGYLKRHASCAYTHPPADAALELRRRHPDLRTEDVVEIDVATHRLAIPLDATAFPTRLAAMFSVPYVVATVLQHGACTPEAFDETRRADPTIRHLAAITRVRLDPELDARLPAERPARVTITLRDGSTRVAEVPNAIGDADHHPFGRAGTVRKLAALLGEDDAMLMLRIVQTLPEAEDVTTVLADLP
jgi:2-methylcitrate dehydratase PrpD